MDYGTCINNIYNLELDPIFERSNADYFKDKPLTYNVPLAILLEEKEEMSSEDFKFHYPLTVRDLIAVTKCDNETEQDALIAIAENELTPRGYALRRLLQ